MDATGDQMRNLLLAAVAVLGSLVKEIGRK